MARERLHDPQVPSHDGKGRYSLLKLGELFGYAAALQALYTLSTFLDVPDGT